MRWDSERKPKRVCFLLGRNSETVLSRLQTGSCLSSLFKAPAAAARSPHRLAGGTLLAAPARHGREALAALWGRRIPPYLPYFYLALRQSHLIALVSTALFLSFPLVLLFLNLRLESSAYL